jgi:hypothetical protein
MSKPARPRIATALVDFESRSRCNLKKRGGRLYWEDPSTEAICAVLYDVERREWHVWEPGDPVPSIGTAVAHNAANFDRFGGARCDWRVQEWIDSSQAARRAGLPGALDKLGKMWLGRDKDKDGSRFTIALSRPSRAKARKGQLPELTGPVRDRVVAYCANDVEIMVKAWPRLEEWFDVDADTCEVDRVINDRGVYLDKDLCRALQKQIARQQEKAIAKAAKALGWSVQETRACAMSPQQFVKATGLENARKDTLAAFNPECEGTTEAAPLVAVRLALASVVPGKLTAALERVSPDNRLRDMLRYYGAHTGRWAGTGLQPHNLNRIGFEDEAKRIGWSVDDYIETLCEAALSGHDLGDMPITDAFHKAIGGDPGKYLVSGLLRSVLVAEPGCTYAVLDYSGVEARANAWAAGDDNAIGVFKALDAGTGPDPYKLMAVDIFGLPLERVEKHHRQIGKNAELGCFAPNTYVLTLRGYVPMVDVRTQDMLWDGVEWVRHAGLVNQGVREVVALAGVRATTDHGVLSDRWTTWGELAANESALCQALARGSESLPSLDISGAPEGAYKPLSCDAVAASVSTRLTSRIYWRGGPRGAVSARSGPQPRHANDFGGTLPCAPTRITGIGCCVASHPRCSGATTRETQRIQITAGAGSESTARGELTAPGFYATYSPCPDGTTHCSTSTESTTTPGMRQGICASFPRAETSLTDPRCGSCVAISSSSSPVYDIANAGPRHRFTILTDRGPLIVHNCGYGMGADKFNDYCAAAGNDLAAMGVEASDVIGAWRTKHRPIVKMWHACEKAFAAAAQGRPMRAGKWLYEPRGADAVACVLPSGRPIMYPNAKVRRVKRTAKDGRTFDAWDMSYQGADPWRSPVYGGLLVENAIQALCRDFLAGALVKLDAAGLRPVLHVHDEAVCEVPHNAGAEALEEMNQIMLDVPRWAKGFPMRLDGFHGRRYRK